MEKSGALHLLTCYNSGSSTDDEDVLPKKVERLPVPEILVKKRKIDNEDFVDDPSLHDGRIRSFPHERGNWATYVYVPYESGNGMKDLIFMLLNNVPSYVELKPIEDFHISLTKTVTLRYHWIDGFVDNIKENITHVTKFVLFFDRLRIYCNEERSRTFIGLKINNGHNDLVKVVEILNKCLQDFRLPIFYKDPSFHMSVAWCVGDFEAPLNAILPQLNNKFHELMNNTSTDDWYINFERLECKIGNKCYNFTVN